MAEEPDNLVLQMLRYRAKQAEHPRFESRGGAEEVRADVTHASIDSPKAMSTIARGQGSDRLRRRLPRADPQLERARAR